MKEYKVKLGMKCFETTIQAKNEREAGQLGIGEFMNNYDISFFNGDVEVIEIKNGDEKL